MANGGRSGRVVVAAGVTLVLWASAFAGIRAGLEDYAPGQLAVLRFAVASLVLVAYAAKTRMRLPDRRDWAGIALTGFLGITVYHLALNYGEVTVGAGPASFLVNAAPVITALLAALALGERLSPWGWAGIIVSFVGVTLIALGEGERMILEPGVLLILGAALATSVYFILQKRYLVRYSALPLTTYAIWAGTLFMLPFAGGLPRAVSEASLGATLAVVYLGVFPAAIAYVTWSYVLSRMPAGRASSFLFLSPPLATVIAWAWLGEAPAAMSLVGGGLALVGVVLVNTRRRQSREAGKQAASKPRVAGGMR